MDPTHLWQLALQDLELQLARATFHTWLKDSTPLSLVGDCLTVSTSSRFAPDWLNTRLHSLVGRTLTRIAQRPLTCTFVARPPSCRDDPLGRLRSPNGPAGRLQPPDDQTARPLPPHDPDADQLIIKLHDFDVTSRGYVVTPSYAIKFWLPLVGAHAFAVYLALRAWYYNPHGDWTRNRPVYMSLLAQTVGCHPQTLTGRRTRVDAHLGALHRLSSEGIARIRVTGSTRTRRYFIAVRNSLPLLTPAQVAKLPRLVQTEHDRFLAAAEIDHQSWLNTQNELHSVQMHEMSRICTE